MKHVELLGLTVEASSRAPLVLLRERDAPRRVLPIFVGPVEAMAIALGLRDELPLRPQTHDLMATLVDTAQARVERVEVTELREGTFFAELALSGPAGERRVDSRPSDAIALAVRVNAPVYVAGAVLDEAGAVLTETLDDQAIEDEVARFRAALEGFDPAQLQPGSAPEPGEPGTGTSRQHETVDPDASGPDDQALGDAEPPTHPEDPPAQDPPDTPPS